MSQKMQEIESLQVEGVQIQDLCLDFTLPGDATYELKVRKSNYLSLFLL
jgi:E3 ubiquitin-protein ligase TRIP12